MSSEDDLIAFQLPDELALLTAAFTEPVEELFSLTFRSCQASVPRGAAASTWSCLWPLFSVLAQDPKSDELLSWPQKSHRRGVVPVHRCTTQGMVVGG
jgi:hypothetical protein